MTTNADLIARLRQVRERIAAMCSERRGPRMSVPADPEHDDDLFIANAADAAADALAAADRRETEAAAREAELREALKPLARMSRHTEVSMVSTTSRMITNSPAR